MEAERHISDELLVALLDGEAVGFEAANARLHLDGCGECRARSARLQSLTEEYAAECEALKRTTPPAAWKSATELFPAARGRSSRIRVWLPAAAALLLAALLFWRFDRPPVVNAAEVLARAVAAEARVTPKSGRRLMVKTRRETFFRPAVYSPGEGDEELRSLFNAAQYDWTDPLSARAYTAWRNRLPQKEDTAERTGKLLKVHTVSAAGPIAQATLTLREDDYRPVAAAWQFRPDEWVEVSEVDPATEARIASSSTPQSGAPAAAASTDPAATEVRVWEALRRAGADLGDPVEVAREGSTVVVRILGLDATREQQVRDALAGIPGVEIRREAAPEPGSAASSAVVTQGAALSEALQRRLGPNVSVEEFTNAALDASDDMLARAHALARLAERFPPGAALDADAAARLATLRATHARSLVASAHTLRQRLAPLLPSGVPPAAAADLLALAQRIDSRLNTLLTGGRAPDDAELREIAAEISALEEAAEREAGQ